MAETMTIEQVLDCIRTATRDEINALAREITARRTSLDDEAINAIKVGDRVVVSQTVSPKYFAGCLATVLEAPRGTRVKVQLDTPPWKAVPRYCKEDGVVNMLLSTLKAA